MTNANTKNRINSVLTLAVVAMATIVLTAASATAAPITVTNDSFENPVYANPGDSGLNHPGWVDVSGNAGTGRTTLAQYPGGIPDGVNYAWTNQAADTLGQTLADTLQANTTYTLTVATGWRDDLQGSWPNYPGYGIELWAGGNLIASDYHDDPGNSGPAAGTWKDVIATVATGAVVTPGQALEIRLLAGDAVNGGTAIQTNYDNVRLDAAAPSAVPEPSTLALAVFGLLSLGFVGWRRRRR